MRVHAATRRVAALGLVALGACIASTAAVSIEGCADKAPKPAAGAPIVIGVSFGLTNGLAAFASPLRDAVRVAEGQINAAGGVLGRPVEFDIQDDQSDEERGIVEGVANGFAARGAVAVIGPIGSQQVVKTHEIYARAKMIQISPSATSVDLTNIQDTSDRWLFRTTPADDFQGAAVLRFAQLTPNGLADAGPPAVVDGSAPPSTCSKLAIVNVDNAYGNSMADVIEKNYPKQNGGSPIVARERIAVQATASYADVIGRLYPKQPQCLALIAYDDVGTAFIAEFKADPRYATLGSGFFWIGTDGMYTDGFLTRGRQDEADPTSPNAAEGVYGTNPDTQPGTKEYNEFRTLYSSYFPLGARDAPAFAANTYDAAVLIALAIQRVGNTTDRAAIRDALVQVSSKPGTPYTPAQVGAALQAAKDGIDIDYKGASGAVDFESNGNVKGGFIVWQAYRTADKKVDYRTVGRFSLDELLGTVQ